MDNNLRVHAIIKGKVQGVCFRLETKYVADRSGVTGWVKNLPNGTVEAIFEGERARVEDVLAWCRKGPPVSKVTAVETVVRPFEGNFPDFLITG